MLEFGLAFIAVIIAAAVGILSNWIKPPEKMTARVVIITLIIAVTAGFTVNRIAASFDSNKKTNEDSSANSQNTQLPVSTTSPKPITTDFVTPPTTTSPETPSKSPTDEATTTSKKPSKVFLSEIHAMNSNSVSSPKVVQIDTTTYTESLTIGCQYPSGTSATYPVAGYNKLTSKVGVDTNEGSSAATQGLRCKVQVFNEKNEQLGEDLIASIGNSGSLALNLDGAVQVTFKCTLLEGRKGYPTAYYPLAFGSPVITT